MSSIGRGLWNPNITFNTYLQVSDIFRKIITNIIKYLLLASTPNRYVDELLMKQTMKTNLFLF